MTDLDPGVMDMIQERSEEQRDLLVKVTEGETGEAIVSLEEAGVEVGEQLPMNFVSISASGQELRRVDNRKFDRIEVDCKGETLRERRGLEE